MVPMAVSVALAALISFVTSSGVNYSPVRVAAFLRRWGVEHPDRFNRCAMRIWLQEQ
jgi:hypothetical protein